MQRKLMKVGDACWLGEMSAGRPHGEGSLILESGSVHSGTFCKGRANGTGTYYDAMGVVTSGSWVDNKRVGAFTTVDLR
jgi:hypothetical protein